MSFTSSTEVSKAIRKAVASILSSHDDNVGTFYQPDDLVTIINSMSGSDDSNAVNATLITNAFSHGGDKTYSISLRNLLPDDYEGTDVLQVYMSYELYDGRFKDTKGKKRYTAIGRFERSTSLSFAAINNGSTRTLVQRSSIDNTIKASLIKHVAAYLKKKNKRESEKKKKRKREDEERKKNEEEESPSKKRRTAAVAEEEKADDDNNNNYDGGDAAMLQLIAAAEAQSIVMPTNDPEEVLAGWDLKSQRDRSAKITIAKYHLENSKEAVRTTTNEVTLLAQQRNVEYYTKQLEDLQTEHANENAGARALIDLFENPRVDDDDSIPQDPLFDESAANSTVYKSDFSDGSDLLHFTMKGKAGVMKVYPGQSITHEDVLAALERANTEEGKTEEDGLLKEAKSRYHREKFGVKDCWVPNNATAKSTSQLTLMQRDVDMLDHLRWLFSDNKQHRFKQENLRYMAACTLLGYGCSDEAAITIMQGALQAVFKEMGLDITYQSLAQGFPSRDTLVSAEKALSTDCLLKVCREIIQDGAKKLGLVTDHGHRKGQDHLVKLLTWAGWDKDGNPTIKTHCIDIDMGGHSGEDAAAAVKLSVGDIMGILKDSLGNDVEIFVITGDSGGGAAVQKLHKALISNHTMRKVSKMLACDCHGMNKPLDIACTESFGKQGIGVRSPYQMVWLFPNILKKIIKDHGRNVLNNMWAGAIDKLLTDEKWRRYANKNCKQAHQELLDKLEEMEECSSEDLDKLTKMIAEAPYNVQDPILSRWGTVLATVEVFVNNWAAIYFFAVAVKQDAANNSHLWQLACALLSLMNNKSQANNDGNIDEFVASFNTATYEFNKLKPGDSPTFLVVLHFLNGFNKAFFHDHFNFLLKDDPVLGKGTFGQIARFGSVRCSIMNEDLLKLENGGFQKMKEFEPYMKALNGVGSGECDQEYFEKATTVFLERFRYVWDKHMGSKYLSSNILHYTLGGDRYHAREFAQWLVDYKDSTSLSDTQTQDVEDEDDGLNFELEACTFRDITITLDSHHTMTHGPVKMNLRKSMQYITAEADRAEILEDEFVDRNFDLIRELAEQEDPINLIDLMILKVEGKWHPLATAIWREICIHSNHQQRCENYVQLSGLLALTGVSEDRRSCRAISVAAIIRRFNQWALGEWNKRKAAEDPPLPPVARVQGAPKNMLFFEFLDDFFKDVDAARQMFGKEKWKVINAKLSSSKHKASTVERNKSMERFEKSLAKPWKILKAEMPAGVDKTARVNGGMYLRLLTKKNNMEEVVHAEMKARKIKMTKKQREDWTIAEKRNKLRQDELARKMKEQEGFGTQGIKVSDITFIEPQSAEMKNILKPGGIQDELLDKEAGIIRFINESEGL